VRIALNVGLVVLLTMLTMVAIGFLINRLNRS